MDQCYYRVWRRYFYNMFNVDVLLCKIMLYSSVCLLCAAVYCKRVKVVESGITWTWPRTTPGGIASLQCPCEARPELTQGVWAVRLCLEAGKWDSTNIDNCFSQVQRLLCNVCMCSPTCSPLNIMLHMYIEDSRQKSVCE